MVRPLYLSIVLLAMLAPGALADQVVLKNGDRLTGQVIRFDGKNLILKSEFAGEVTIQWSGIQQITSDQSLHVESKNGQTAIGTVTTSGGKLDIATRTGSTVAVPQEEVALIQNGAEQSAAVLGAIANGLLGGYSIGTNGLGQNGWGASYLGGYGLGAAIAFEFVATLLFIVVILGSTQEGAPAQFAGLAIGITLVAIHIFGINITGVSVNPARSLGPAFIVGGQALSQVWLFLIVPTVAGLFAGACSVPARLPVNNRNQF